MIASRSKYPATGVISALSRPKTAQFIGHYILSRGMEFPIEGGEKASDTKHSFDSFALLWRMNSVDKKGVWEYNMVCMGMK